jgi:hypothetical protein
MTTRKKSLEGNALFPDRPDSLILILLLLSFPSFLYHYYFSPFLRLQRHHAVMASLCTFIMTVICHFQLLNHSAGVHGLNLTGPAIFSFWDRYRNRTRVIPEDNSTGRLLGIFNGGPKHLIVHLLF